MLAAGPYNVSWWSMLTGDPYMLAGAPYILAGGPYMLAGGPYMLAGGPLPELWCGLG